MQSLQETLMFINKNYPQGAVRMDDFDLVKGHIILRDQPRYLFRGERTVEWTTTKPTVSRMKLLTCPDFDEINYWLTGLHMVSGDQLNPYSLYFFLREALWGVSIVDSNFNNPDVQKQIAGIMQHYGFDTSFIDFTSDVNVAAFFASHEGSVGSVGQILITPTDNIENQFFDLTNDIGDRLKRQKAYALGASTDLDLKSGHYVMTTNSIWIPFELTVRDKETFDNEGLLSIEGDMTAHHILDWYDSHIRENAKISILVKSYFQEKITRLRN